MYKHTARTHTTNVQRGMRIFTYRHACTQIYADCTSEMNQDESVRLDAAAIQTTAQDDNSNAPASVAEAGRSNGWAQEHKFGTVGCVARDKYGNLAAAGSTGGLTNKRSGRIGDTPIIGAGVYANSSTCAVACTGQGETFIKVNTIKELPLPKLPK